MGYDIHIVRTRRWLEAKQKPITEADVEALVAADGELRFSADSYSVMRSAETGEDVTFYAIEWKAYPYFSWDGIEITSKSPPEAVICKMVGMASALGAMVVGDDDEICAVRKSLFGKLKLGSTQME
jgi:hypothetical protein